MCRPAKRPKPVAAVDFVPLKAEELEPMVVAANKKQESNAPFVSLTELLEEAPSDLFELMPASTSGSSSPDSSNASVVDEPRPKTFVYTAFDMVSNEDNAAAVGFTADGTALEIRDLVMLSEKILPLYFRHKNVTSFYRQLNSYGFRTIRSASAEIAHTFAHERFVRGHPELLSCIVRKKCNPRTEKPASASAAKKEPVVVVAVEQVVDAIPEVVIPAVTAVPEVSEEDMQLRQVREHAEALEAHNRALKAANEAILMESERIFRTMNEMVENQTGAIQKLFGVEAAKAFSEQAKPFRFDVAPAHTMEKSIVVAPTPQIQTQAQDFTEFVGETDDLLFQDDELQMLENIFTLDTSALLA